MGATAAYYHTHPAAYRRKLKTDKKINARPEQRRKRVNLVKKNREAGTYGNHDGKDYDHRTRRFIKASVNRGAREKSKVPGYKAKFKSKQ